MLIFGRCHIPECDAIEPMYEAPWLKNAIPFYKDHPSTCDRYSPAVHNDTHYRMCPSNLFVNTSIERCDKFVFDTEDVTILQEVSILFYFFNRFFLR